LAHGAAESSGLIPARRLHVSVSAHIKPIAKGDLPAVGAFLARHFGVDRSLAEWLRAITPTWRGDADHGFLLRADDGRIGGVIVQFWAERRLGGQSRRTCSLSSWFVLPEFREDSIQLLVRATRDPDAVYVNFTPAARTVRIFERMGFQRIDTTEWVIMNVPVPWRPALSDQGRIGANLTGAARDDLIAHAGFRRLRHVGLWSEGGDFCHVAFVRSRFHLIPAARVIYASDWALFKRVLKFFRSVVLSRFGLPLTVVEQRRLDHRPAYAIAQTAPQLILFRGTGISAGAIDGLYSELVTFA
jgi:hypothetical protein